MIGYLEGKVTHLQIDSCFLKVCGIGYRVFISTMTRQKITPGSDILLFTYLHVREDALLLYGFYSQTEYEMFQHLLAVSGIGPKVAMGVLSAMTPERFYSAVSHKNLDELTRLPGIGKKTAERIILELKDKMGAADFDTVADFTAGSQTNNGELTEQALQALLALGYTQSEVLSILRKVAPDAKTVEELIKAVLKEFVRR